MNSTTSGEPPLATLTAATNTNHLLSHQLTNHATSPHLNGHNEANKKEEEEEEDYDKFIRIEQPAASQQQAGKIIVASSIQLSDFVGEHGAYQLSLTLILFLRYVLLGLMANSGPLLTPDVTFYCHLPRAEMLAIMPNISSLSAREQELEIKEEFKRTCQLDLHLYLNQSNLAAFNSSHAFKVGAPSPIQAPLSPPPPQINTTTTTTTTIGQNHNQNLEQQHHHHHHYHQTWIRECTEFTYELAQDQGRTMTSEFDLVCEREWLRSLFQSLLSAAIVVAHIFWGTFSDKYGRYQAQRLCLIVSLFAGLLSIFAVDFWTFTLARSLCSLGDLGLVVSLTTTVVELVGSKYRGMSVALVNFGYALGVTLLPYIVAYFEDFRLVVALTVLCHLLTMPLILTTNESVRWLLTNRKFKRAKKELWRIARCNGNYSMFCTRFLTSANENFSIKIMNASEVGRLANSRVKFDQLFNLLVKQIEAQNLCDPINDENSRDPIEQTDVEEAIKELNEIEAIQRRQQQIESNLNRRRNQQPAIIISTNDGGSIGSLKDDNENIMHTEDASSVSGSYQRCPVRRQSSLSSLSYINGQPLDEQAIRQQPHKGGLIRATSCIELSDESRNKKKQQQELGLVDEDVMLASRRLTLPPEALVGYSNKPPGADNDFEYLRGKNYNYSFSLGLDLDYRHQFRRRPVRHRHRQQPDCMTSCNLVAHQLSFVGRVSRLFKDKKLMIAVITIVWTTFNSELQYTSFIIINLEVGEDLYLNYILGGCMEALAAISASLLLSYAPRRQSLITFWLLISLFCFGLSIAHIDSTWAVWLLALAKFSQSCLSSIASVAAYESFPTFLRQSGSGLVFTLGMLGSVFAPLIFAEFDDHAGMDRVLMTFSFSSLTAAALVYMFLNETRDCELQ